MNSVIENAVNWASKLGFDKQWIKRIQAYDPCVELVPFDEKNKVLFAKKDLMLNLICYLNYCDIAEAYYTKKNIPQHILIDTLLDIKIWAYRHKEIFGEYGLKEINWTQNNIKGVLFRIGRLQYKFGKAYYWSRKHKLRIGEPILEIHIPRGERLIFSECEFSFSSAKEFFAKYFPEYKYDHYTCGSWMLDDKTLPNLLSADSNILAFQDAFHVLLRVRKYDCIRFVFGEHKNSKNLDDLVTKTSFQTSLKEHICSGKPCYVGYGILKDDYK